MEDCCHSTDPLPTASDPGRDQLWLLERWGTPDLDDPTVLSPHHGMPIVPSGLRNDVRNELTDGD